MKELIEEINEKLLCDVLDIELSNINENYKVSETNKQIMYWQIDKGGGKSQHYISTCDLESECKEKANFEYHYYVISGINKFEKLNYWCSIQSFYGGEAIVFKGKSSIEPVLKAYNWIIK